jgi:uroporphyrin-III C-methyltransferase
LLAQGRAASTPVVVVENCSRDNQRILRLRLDELESGLQQCEGPVLVMIGEALASRAQQPIEIDQQQDSRNTA